MRQPMSRRPAQAKVALSELLFIVTDFGGASTDTPFYVLLREFSAIDCGQAFRRCCQRRNMHSGTKERADKVSLDEFKAVLRELGIYEETLLMKLFRRLDQRDQGEIDWHLLLLALYGRQQKWETFATFDWDKVEA